MNPDLHQQLGTPPRSFGLSRKQGPAKVALYPRPLPGPGVVPRPYVSNPAASGAWAVAPTGHRNGDDAGQVRARSRPDGPVAAAIPAIRTKAVMPTAAAPITEKMVCQVSEGMVYFTMPCVAW